MAEDMKRAIRAKAEALAAQAAQRLAARRVASSAAGVPVAAPTSAASGGDAEPAAFRSSIPWTKEGRAGTLVIMCSSSRFLPQTGEFLARGLHLPSYELVAIPGGIQWLALPDLLPKNHKVARWATEYLIRKHRVTRVVCIAHQGCSAYEDESVVGTLAHLATGKSASEHQVQQLLKVGRELRESFRVSVDLYYATVTDGVVVFRKVEEPAEPA